VKEDRREVTIYEDMSDWKTFVREKNAVNHAASLRHSKILKSTRTVTIVESDT
jgi:hypothetical protein